jgi:hypothetical protein
MAGDADTVVKRLALADSGFRDLEVRGAGLAEAFTELTQEPTQEPTQKLTTQEVAS